MFTVSQIHHTTITSYVALHKGVGRLTDENMKECGANDSVCRKDVMFADMDEYYHIDMGSPCLCSDVCMKVVHVAYALRNTVCNVVEAHCYVVLYLHS